MLPLEGSQGGQFLQVALREGSQADVGGGGDRGRRHGNDSSAPPAQSLRPSTAHTVPRNLPISDCPSPEICSTIQAPCHPPTHQHTHSAHAPKMYALLPPRRNGALRQGATASCHGLLLLRLRPNSLAICLGRTREGRRCAGDACEGGRGAGPAGAWAGTRGAPDRQHACPSGRTRIGLRTCKLRGVQPRVQRRVWRPLPD